MVVSKALSLVGTGVALGVFHVLTGPDHLSALATLSANVGNCQAFYLGVRWGIGHSTGLVLVGVVLILLSLDSDAETVQVPDGVSEFFESLVGIFMIGLGFYGLRRAWMKRPTGYGVVYDNAPGVVVGSAQDDEADDDVETTSMEESGHSHALGHPSSFPLHVDSNHHHGLTTRIAEASETDPSISEMEDDSYRYRVCNLAQNVSTRTMALCAGIIHGLAGPGGVLGVIPAVQLHNLRLATIYLGCFCFSSTLTMGVFAATYGTCSSSIGRGPQRQFQIECVSASLSILVGITWLTLLSIGKLDDVFP